MEQRKFYLNLVIVVALGLAWVNLAPRLLPGLFPPPPKAPPRAPAVAKDAQEQLAESNPNADTDAEGETIETADIAETEVAKVPDELHEHPHQLVELGSLDPTSGYFQRVTINSTGAAIAAVELNDPRYIQADNRELPLKLVGSNPKTDLETLQLSIVEIDAQLSKLGTSLNKVDWEVIPGETPESKVTLQYRAPDGSIEIRKHFHLNKGNPDDRDADPMGYQLEFDLEIVNLTSEPRELTYMLQGPVGLPLENKENSRAFIEVKVGALEEPTDPDDVTAIQQYAGKIVEQTDEAESKNDPDEVEDWKAPLKYIGVDVQYFAALLFPEANQLQSRFFKEARPIVVTKDPKRDAWSDVSVQLRSEPFTITPGEPLKHEFHLFFGPKRSDLLQPLGAGGVKTFGWFRVISRGMLSILHFFHDTLMAPYGLAIILLTVVVRACLFPVSRKMAQNQQRMKELQPKMQEIRTKYKDDQEKMAQAYREFMAKNGFNPLAGCLPMFLQLPIFLGLYQALLNSVDLRMAKFLWVDNLVAPDQLFAFGFALPLVGWTHFNLLPLITVALFAIQQKMFMPEPTTEEQEMQQKMMKYLNVFMLYIFYSMPAGLCVYFITSSGWGIIERKLLVLTGDGGSTESSSDVADGNEQSDRKGPDGNDRRGGSGNEPDDDTPKAPGFLQRIMEAADEARNQTNGSISKRDNRNQGKGGGRKKSKGRR
ncbi:MAG: membrane protein insertase YidC [Planctomycetaceae bacterium]|nr:membrane protein insertase YidC [Planctomycetaceae bacterium]